MIYNINDKYIVNSDIVVKAEWKDKVITNNNSHYSKPSYKIMIEESVNGEVSSNCSKAHSGERIIITIIPDKGITIKDIKVSEHKYNINKVIYPLVKKGQTTNHLYINHPEILNFSKMELILHFCAWNYPFVTSEYNNTLRPTWCERILAH